MFGSIQSESFRFLLPLHQEMAAAMSNAQIADAILAEAREAEGYRASALLKAAQIIRTFPAPIINANQLKGVGGIGEGTRRRVAEILAKGVEYRHAPPPPSPTPAAEPEIPEHAFDFCAIKFIGPATKAQLYRQGIYTRQQLEEGVRAGTVALNANQRAGLRYCDDLAERVPRAEVEQIGQQVIAAARAEGMNAQIVGSYRRGKADSGDVDVLITADENHLHAVVDRLKREGLIQYTFSLGPVKFMGVAIGATSGIYRSLDIRYVPPEDWGTFLLFATGPYQLNVIQREKAISKGWKLSEYGLFDEHGVKLPSATEADVFRQLGMDYLTPEEREAYNID